MSETTVADIAFDDLSAAHERMYVAALRYVRAFERHEIAGVCGEEGMPIGVAAAALSESASRYREAYDRCESTGFFED